MSHLRVIIDNADRLRGSNRGEEVTLIVDGVEIVFTRHTDVEHVIKTLGALVGKDADRTLKLVYADLQDLAGPAVQSALARLKTYLGMP